MKKSNAKLHTRLNSSVCCSTSSSRFKVDFTPFSESLISSCLRMVRTVGRVEVPVWGVGTVSPTVSPSLQPPSWGRSRFTLSSPHHTGNILYTGNWTVWFVTNINISQNSIYFSRKIFNRQEKTINYEKVCWKQQTRTNTWLLTTWHWLDFSSESNVSFEMKNPALVSGCWDQ